MKIAIVTDSTAYIPDPLLKKLNIHTVPLSVVFGNESFREHEDITNEQFYNKMRNVEELPTTSQPAIGTFVEMYEQLSKDFDAIISIHISSKLSGTFGAAQSAGNMVENVEVHLFDTELSAMPQGLFVIAAGELAQQGKNDEEILAHLMEMKEKTRTYFMVDDLTNLQKGGRLSSAQKLLGSVLNIKPILHLVEGVIVPFEKVRTRKKAIKRMMDMLNEDAREKKVVKAVFMHGNNEEAAKELRDAFSEQHPNVEIIISCLGPVIGTHLGENALGVSWYTE